MWFPTRISHTFVACLMVSGLLFPGLVSAQDADTGNLGIPAPGSVQSGIGIVSGWKCSSNGLTARFDGGDQLPIAYGTPRGDTLGLCADPEQQNTAFALQWNYSNLEDGEHVLEILDGGEVWRSVNFSVQRLAGQRFLRGVERCLGLEGFPGPDEMQHVEWQQSSQSFVLVSGCDMASASNAAGSLASVRQADSIPGSLENPGPGAKMSGIGIVSGWRCEGSRITAQFDDRDPIEVAYGTPRGDTRGQCADPDRVNNAYVLQWNYALLGDGEHTLRLFDDGMEFASTTFSVQTLGAPFVRGLEGEYLIESFPEETRNAVIEWQQGKQGFGVILSEPISMPEPTPTPGPTGPFDRNVLLGQFADAVVLPAVRDFASRAQGLANATRTWAGSLSASSRQAAQAAWTDAMESFQFLEPMQFGPAGSATAFAGGLGIRDEIYSWPTVNYCAVDQVTVDGDFDAGDFFQSSLVNVYGLDALELLLFRTEAENACSSRIDINRNGTWDDLVGAGQLVRRQADYAVVLADGILSQAQRLQDAWEPSGGNFAADLRNAGQGSSVYGSAKEAIDEVFAAFFVVDTKIKDLKLAIPAGISPDCPSEVCPEDVELPYSLSSKAALVANLDGLLAVFSGTGANNGGFVWYLQDVGASALAIRMSSQLDKTHEALEAIEGSLSSALVEDPATVILAYTEIQLFATDMKSEFVSILNLAVPQEGAGDND